MNEDTNRSTLRPPASVDPNWAAKIRAAKQARELGKQLRAGKPAQRSRIVGHHA